MVALGLCFQDTGEVLVVLMGRLGSPSQNQDHAQGYYYCCVRSTERGMVAQYEYDQRMDGLRFDAGVSFVEMNVSGTVCANANH